MKVLSGKSKLNDVSADLVVVAVTEADCSLRKRAQESTLDARALGTALKIDLRKLFDAEQFKGRVGDTVAHWIGGGYTKAILFVGWSEKPKDRATEIEAYRKLGNRIYRAAAKWGLKKIALSEYALRLSSGENLAAVIEGVELSRYAFQTYKKKKGDRRRVAAELVVLSRKKMSSEPIRIAHAGCVGTDLARDLVNTPACDCTPRHLVKIARKVARDGKLQVRVYDEAKLKQLGARLLLAVGRGSKQPSALIRLTYKPRKKIRKVVSLVGKGITFDSGGYSIKSGVGMETMKCDMAGAAAVIGAMKAISAIRPGVEVRAYIPAAENMVSSDAVRPGDVVKGLNGKTVEILNTDAEGRLILADALALAVREGCDSVVNVATLTGACVVALGSKYAGLFSTDDKLATQLLTASEVSGEPLWRMPLVEEYRKSLKSKIADLKNIGSRATGGGSITAALFLSEFVGKSSWAHLDIAGPAFTSSVDGYNPAGGVGFGVRTLVRYVLGAR